MDHRSLGRCVFHHPDLGLRLPLVELAEALTPGYHMSPLRGFSTPEGGYPKSQMPCDMEDLSATMSNPFLVAKRRHAKAWGVAM
jgi:hypothetical protein